MFHGKKILVLDINVIKIIPVLYKAELNDRIGPLSIGVFTIKMASMAVLRHY